jgi:hypothetical protein
MIKRIADGWDAVVGGGGEGGGEGGGIRADGKRSWMPHFLGVYTPPPPQIN